uniref:Uncharacterized protein n=1 Tax=Romanomermis culicivorax TaxID=13658 RepID=A0A915JY77_ROMCU
MVTFEVKRVNNLIPWKKGRNKEKERKAPNGEVAGIRGVVCGDKITCLRTPDSSIICCTMWPGGTCNGSAMGGGELWLLTIRTVAGPIIITRKKIRIFIFAKTVETVRVTLHRLDVLRRNRGPKVRFFR